MYIFKLPYSLCVVFFVLFFIFGCTENKTEWKPGQALPKEKIKIGIIHPNQINPESGYDYMHHLGIMQMQNKIGLTDRQFIRKINVFEARPGEVENAILECIADGANIILALSWGYGEVCEKMAEKFPSVIFAHATGNKHNSTNFTNYAGRMYEARYLSGIAAGLKTKSKKIGFVAAMGKDNSEVTSGIDAFALGVEKVNPSARIYIKVTHSWFDQMGETDAANALITKGCDVIAQHCNAAYPVIAAEKRGVWGIGYNSDMSDKAPNAVITSAVFDWGVYYTHLIKSVINGTFTTEPYFEGLAAGMVSITPLNEKLISPEAAAAVEAEQKRITDGAFNVFDGVMQTNAGTTVGTAGTTFSAKEIIGGMNWYYRTVIEEK